MYGEDADATVIPFIFVIPVIADCAVQVACVELAATNTNPALGLFVIVIADNAPPDVGVCQVAVEPPVAVNTCPFVGAVAADTLTVVVADFNPFAMSAVPQVAAFKFETRVVELTTRGAVPVATVLINCEAVEIAPTALILAAELIHPVACKLPPIAAFVPTVKLVPIAKLVVTVKFAPTSI